MPGRSREYLATICRLPARPGRKRGRPTRLEAAERAWAQEEKELKTAHGRSGPLKDIMGRPPRSEKKAILHESQ